MNNETNVPKNIFKSYDIRGVYPTEINEELAYRIGRAIVTFLSSCLPTCRSLIVGKDMRISSPQLWTALSKGVNEQGWDIFDIGEVSSDMFYFACGSEKLPGVIITASHNPPEYNGVKCVIEMPKLLSGENGMKEIYTLVKENVFTSGNTKGAIFVMDIKKGYRESIRSVVDTDSIQPVKIVVDGSNGMGGVAFDIVCDDLPLEVVKIFFKPDGTFPNHGGDPLQEKNKIQLQQRVIKEKAEMGFIFDPDADRFFVVDKSGVSVPGDFVTALLGKYFITKNKGGSVVYDTRSSWAVRDYISAAGGKPIEYRVGHSFIKAKMLESNAVFGGEVSGHYYFPKFYYADSGVLTALALLVMLGDEQKTLTEYLDSLRKKYFLSGEINSSVNDPDRAIDEITKIYKKTDTVYFIDGVSIVSKENDWHANIRKSNTEPLLRLNVEGMSHEIMAQKRDDLLHLIRSH